MKVRMNREQALAKFARFTAAMRERYERVHSARKALIDDGIEPTCELIKQRAEFTSTGTVYSYLEVILALEGGEPEAEPADTGPAAEPFSDAIAKLTNQAKLRIDQLGEAFMAIIKSALEEGQRRSQVALEAQIQASEAALREARTEADSARIDANTMAEEVESFALRTAELEEQLDAIANERALLDASLQETKSSLKDRDQQVAYLQTRMTNQERLEEFVRLELETERTERHSAQRELKAESVRRHETDTRLAGLQEQLESRVRENGQLRVEISALQRKITSLEDRLLGTVSVPGRPDPPSASNVVG
jgi:multidrug efflux pump subunit AcrA (membrane-fusion protein)